MPTGYTAGVRDGKVTSFRDYALACTRAFGATITMRDDPSDTPLPDTFQPSDYYFKRINEVEAEIADLEGATDERVAEMAEAEFREAATKARDRACERMRWRERYESMLEQAESWEPPTEEHREFGEFLVSQLKESIDFDCAPFPGEFPTRMAPEQWRSERLANLRQTLAFNKERAEDEIERCAQRTAWLNAVRKSLDVEDD